LSIFDGNKDLVCNGSTIGHMSTVYIACQGSGIRPYFRANQIRNKPSG
jgi:hypothetical protein